MNQMVITAIGEDQPGLVDRLTQKVMDYRCNIADSRMMVLGGEFAILLLAEGNWNNIVKLQDHLEQMSDDLNMQISVKPTTNKTPTSTSVSYSVDVIALDHPGIVQNLASFFSKRSINIQDLSTTSYAAAHTGSPMFSVRIIIDLPAKTHIASLREEFQGFCDELNLDASIEPVTL